MSIEKRPTNDEREPNFWETPSRYEFALLDPRPIPRAKESNEKVFAEAKHGVLGVELTIPEYAARCDYGNIDPQHTDGDITKAAIDVAVNFPLPQEGTRMVTVRPDIDAIGSMALLSLRQKGLAVNDAVRERVQKISALDTFSRSGWPGKRELPTKENPWFGEGKELAGILGVVNDFKKPAHERVQSLERWLETGDEPDGYREQILKEKFIALTALEQGEILVEEVDNNVVFVESKHQAGTSIGYLRAPVVVAFNPEFKSQRTEAYRKYTVCQYGLGNIDLVSALKEIQTLEEGWGGSPTIIGSPQGKSSELSKEQVLEVVKKYTT